MLPKALREARTGQPRPTRRLRCTAIRWRKEASFATNMAIVTAVWQDNSRSRAQLTSSPRLQRAPERSEARKPQLPRPQNKRVSARRAEEPRYRSRRNV
jgi:hypothetical protein